MSSKSVWSKKQTTTKVFEENKNHNLKMKDFEENLFYFEKDS